MPYWFLFFSLRHRRDSAWDGMAFCPQMTNTQCGPRTQKDKVPAMTPHMLQRRRAEEAGLLFKMNFLERVALGVPAGNAGTEVTSKKPGVCLPPGGDAWLPTIIGFCMFPFFCADTFLLSKQKKQKRDSEKRKRGCLLQKVQPRPLPCSWELTRPRQAQRSPLAAWL